MPTAGSIRERILMAIAGEDVGDLPTDAGNNIDNLLIRIAKGGASAGMIADAYDATSTYSKDDLCTHEGKLYKANQAISTAEEWDAEHWTETDIATELADVADPEAIAEAVGDWLGDHVDPDTGYVIDDTLLIEGAAADAKKVGVEIADVKSAITQLDGAVEELEQGSLSALGATAGQVPVAHGDGTWGWGWGKNVAVESPAALQMIVASGKANETFSIGDVIYVPWTNYTPSTPVQIQMPFVVVDIADCYDENNVKHENALWLQAMYAEPEEMVFDEPEAVVATEETFTEGWYYFTKNNDNSYTQATVTYGEAIPASPTYYKHRISGAHGASIIRYGYNRWRDSAYRQWLNSDAAKNANWWTAQHDCDVAPTSTYTSKPGWLYGFSQDWLAIFKKVKVDTACNTVTDGGVTDTTYDKFFLPSLEQMYGSPQAADVEGKYWPWWKERTGLESPSNGSSSDTNDARKIPQVQQAPKGSAVYCRLRSAGRGNSYYVWSVHYAGYLSNYSAYNAYRAFPACVIY